MVAQVESGTDTFDQFWNEIADSPDEGGRDAALLADTGTQEAGQSSAQQDGVAPQSDDAQQADSLTGDGTDPAASPADESTAPVPAAPAWDSPENPYYQDAQALATLRQLAEQQRQEQAHEAQMERWRQGGTALAEADEADIPYLMDTLVQEISATATAPHVERVGVLEHGMIALVAALEDELPADAYARIKERAASYREMGLNAQQVEQAHTFTRSQADTVNKMKADYESKIKTLSAQLAGKQVQQANRHESVAVGAQGSIPESWDQLLGD